jgi:hypothetical protein
MSTCGQGYMPLKFHFAVLLVLDMNQIQLVLCINYKRVNNLVKTNVGHQESLHLLNGQYWP